MAEPMRPIRGKQTSQLSFHFYGWAVIFEQAIRWREKNPSCRNGKGAKRRKVSCEHRGKTVEQRAGQIA